MITNIWHVMPGYVLASPTHVISQQASQASLRHPVMGNVTADASSSYVVYQSEVHPTALQLPLGCVWHDSQSDRHQLLYRSASDYASTTLTPGHHPAARAAASCTRYPCVL